MTNPLNSESRQLLPRVNPSYRPDEYRFTRTSGYDKNENGITIAGEAQHLSWSQGPYVPIKKVSRLDSFFLWCQRKSAILTKLPYLTFLVGIVVYAKDFFMSDPVQAVRQTTLIDPEAERNFGVDQNQPLLGNTWRQKSYRQAVYLI